LQTSKENKKPELENLVTDRSFSFLSLALVINDLSKHQELSLLFIIHSVGGWEGVAAAGSFISGVFHRFSGYKRLAI
jgi:hypothetical protein